MSVPRLVLTSAMEVVMVPYVRGGTFSLIINQTESRALPPQGAAESQLTAYAASKLRAERLVLKANGARLANGTYPHCNCTSQSESTSRPQLFVSK